MNSVDSSFVSGRVENARSIAELFGGLTYVEELIFDLIAPTIREHAPVAALIAEKIDYDWELDDVAIDDATLSIENDVQKFTAQATFALFGENERADRHGEISGRLSFRLIDGVYAVDVGSVDFYEVNLNLGRDDASDDDDFE